MGTDGKKFRKSMIEMCVGIGSLGRAGGGLNSIEFKSAHGLSLLPPISLTHILIRGKKKRILEWEPIGRLTVQQSYPSW